MEASNLQLSSHCIKALLRETGQRCDYKHSMFGLQRQSSARAIALRLTCIRTKCRQEQLVDQLYLPRADIVGCIVDPPVGQRGPSLSRERWLPLVQAGFFPQIVEQPEQLHRRLLDRRNAVRWRPGGAGRPGSITTLEHPDVQADLD